MMIVSIYLLAEKQEKPPEKVLVWQSTLSRLTRYGPMLFRPPITLHVLCTGIGDGTGIGDEMFTRALTPVYDQPQYLQGEFLHNPVPLLFPAIDFVFIVGIVTSLIAIAFTYDLIVGEKQKGTLRLILSNSVPRHYVLSAKWLGSFLSFLIGYVPGLLTVLLYMELHPAILLSGADYISILIIDLLSILYAACFFSLGLFVSCRCSDSRTSLLILLMLWTLLTLIIPSISAYVGAMLRPIPPPYQVEKQVQLIQQEAYSKTLEKISSYEKRQNAIPSQERSERLREYQNQVVWEEIQSVYRDVSNIRNSYTSKLYYTHELIRNQKEFVIAFPGPGLEKAIEDTGSCSGRDVDKFNQFGLNSLEAKGVKPPLLSGCVVNLECKLEGELEAGDHTIFLGRVVAAYVDEEVHARLLNFSGKFAVAIPQE